MDVTATPRHFQWHSMLVLRQLNPAVLDCLCTAPSLLSCCCNQQVQVGLLLAFLLFEPSGFLYADHLPVQLQVKRSQWPSMVKRINRRSLKWRNMRANKRFLKCDMCCIHPYIQRPAWGKNMQMFYWWEKKLFKRLDFPPLSKSQKSTAALS